MPSKKQNGKGRARNFATVIYPESAPKDWIEKLEQFFVPTFISPLHNLDKLPTGESKKPHHHVMIMFDGVKTNEQVKQIFDAIGGVGLERIATTRGYARYLCHLDSPDKAQYKKEDVKSLCGADYIAVIGLASDKYTAIREIIEFCKETSTYSYSDLLEYCAFQREDWFRVLCDNGTVVIKEYLKSKAWTDNNARTIIDKKTGEISGEGGNANE